MDAVTQVPTPVNEPVHDYAPGSPERARLIAELDRLATSPLDIRQVIGGEHRTATGPEYRVVQPHHHAKVIGSYTEKPPPTDVHDAIEASQAAAPAWRTCPSTIARPSSSGPPTCWPDRGVSGWPRPPCWASPRRRTRPRSTPPAS